MSKLHPTLKACRCGLICDRSSLYKHLDQVRTHYDKCHMTAGEFWADHGEVPLNEDDPRVAESTLEAQLTQSLASFDKVARRQQVIDSL